RLGGERRLLLLRSLRDALAVRVLLRAQLLIGGDGLAAGPVGGERGVDRVGRLPPGLLRAPDQLGILAKKHWIDHPTSLVGRTSRTPWRCGLRVGAMTAASGSGDEPRRDDPDQPADVHEHTDAPDPERA